MDALCVILEMLFVLQPHSTDLTLEPIPLLDVGQMLPLEVLCQVSGLANLEVRFSNGKLCSPKQRKQVVVLFSVNTNNIASLNACFSASAAASWGLVSFDGIGLVRRLDDLLRGRAAALPSWKWQ